MSRVREGLLAMRPRRKAPAVAGLAFATMLIVTNVASARFFDALVGGGRPQAPDADTAMPPRATLAALRERRKSGPVVTFCVRLCDGRYFPIQRHAGATAVQVCSGLCPAAQTKTFTGPDISRASGVGGSRYGDLANAFVYRQTIVPGCTCNGRDAFGLAPIDIANDPTLHVGDIVVTPNGAQTITGAHAQPRKGDRGAAASRRIATTGAASGN